jgi:predicted DNA-binding transcriptional regulator AlpA
MRTDMVPIPTASPAGPPPDRDKLLIDMAELARLTSLSVRTLRRMDAARDIPGRVAVGRRVLFQTEVIREWVRAGLPGREHWAALSGRNGRR